MRISKPAEAVRAEADAPVLITMGEPAGIGPEIAVAAYATLNGKAGAHPLKLVGDPAVFAACGDVPAHAIMPVSPHATRRPGVLEPHNAPAVIEAIRFATEAALRGRAAAIVTAPIHKSVLTSAGFAFPGHTEYLAYLTGAPRAVMMLASDALRVVPLTIHIPLSDAPRQISTDTIVESGEIILQSLTRDFGIAQPRLAIAGLNPHAGENGTLGREEESIIVPAIAALRARGHAVLGPLSADTMFHAEARKAYDAALCMYHDQALIPIKALSFWDGVNVTLGLPIVRASPDHGTALDIAGQGKADPRSMIAAIHMAAAMADARAQA